MVDFTRSMIDPLQDRQFKTVFAKFDRNKEDALTWVQFQEFVYSIGLQFLCDDFENELQEVLFKGSFDHERASYDEFKVFIDQHTKFEEGPDQYEKDMAIFDEDHNGMANVEDVKRVCKHLAGMGEDEIALFVKKCIWEQLDEEQRNKTPIEQIPVPEQFNISKSTKNLFNV